MTAGIAAPQYRHATALVIGAFGILIEGPSGSGKSSIAATLLRQAGTRGCFARLVGDDRVDLTVAGGRLVARPHPAVAGLLERRGTGLTRVDHEPACVLHLVAIILPTAAGPATRLPDAPPLWRLADVALPLLLIPGSLGIQDSAGRLAEAVAGLV